MKLRTYCSKAIPISQTRTFNTILSLQRAALTAFIVMAGTNAVAGAMSLFNRIQEPGSWKGVYIGAQLGTSWNRTNWQYTNPNYFNTLGPVILGNNFNFRSNGVAGGGNLGFNYQNGPLVLGLEGSVLGVDLEDKIMSPFFPTVDVYTSNVHWVATVKGRAGYACEKLLVYIDGGWAGGDTSLTLLDTEGNIRANSRLWANGWTAGAGADYKLTANLALGVAYDFIRLNVNNKSISCPSCGTGVGLGTPSVDGQIKIQAVTARLNYLFNL